MPRGVYKRKPVTDETRRIMSKAHSGLNCSRETRKKYSEAKTIHGMCKTIEYNAWKNMKTRCNNPNTPYYKNYGGRGIKVCERWLNSFENFYIDMGDKPKGLTLDRIDNNGNYEPYNCRWTSYKKQTNNTRPYKRGYKK